jgi:hypothetical protein
MLGPEHGINCEQRVKHATTCSCKTEKTIPVTVNFDPSRQVGTATMDETTGHILATIDWQKLEAAIPGITSYEYDQFSIQTLKKENNAG